MNHHNIMGRSKTLTDSTKKVVWKAQNTSYDSNVVQSSIGAFNIGFPGQYYDVESNLWYNWNRYYDASIGRYTQNDPIGLAGGLNTYAYVGNNPVGAVDPMGLETVVAIGRATSGNPFGHVAIAFSGQGVYSSGTGTPYGGSFTQYMGSQANYRNSTLYFLNTTPQQESRMIGELLKYDPNKLPNPRKDLLGALSDTCATRTDKALREGGIKSIFAPITTPFPTDIDFIMRRLGADSVNIPQGGSIPSNLSRFNP